MKAEKFDGLGYQTMTDDEREAERRKRFLKTLARKPVFVALPPGDQTALVDDMMLTLEVFAECERHACAFEMLAAAKRYPRDERQAIEEVAYRIGDGVTAAGIARHRDWMLEERNGRRCARCNGIHETDGERAACSRREDL